MGPTIILDKSVLQALSQRELDFLCRYYYVVMTPVLISEIQADLAKTQKDREIAEADVQHLARKLQPLDSVVNVHYRHPCVSSLLGYRVPMTGQALVPPGIPVEVPGLGRGLVLDQSDITGIIAKWQDGIFSEEDEVSAQRWRRYTTGLDLEGYSKSLRSSLTNLPEIRNMKELGREVAVRTSDPSPESQLSSIRGLVRNLRLPQRLVNAIHQRWHDEGLPLFQHFAPYAFHCFRAELTFYIGLASGVITPKPTNFIDLEYIWYLPFCMVFSSGDRFHREISDLFLRQNQTPEYMNQDFLERDDLKRDLRFLADEWSELSETERAERETELGGYPPINRDSVTYQMWEKYMRPRPQSGSAVSPMSEEEALKILEKLRPALETIRKKGQKGQRA